MMGTIGSNCVPFSLVLMMSCWIMIYGAQSCTPNSPVAPPKTSSQSSSTTGLQALVPSYNFSCNGIITQVTFRANKFVNGGFVFQIWRPHREGMYTLQSSVSAPQSAKRNGDDVTFNCSIPVLIGDTIGYRLPYVSGSEEMRFILQSETDVVLYRRMTEDVLCGLSLCDNSTLATELNLAPFISVEFDEQEEPPEPMGGDVVCTDPMEITPRESSLLPSSTPSTRDPPTGSPEDTQDDTLVNVNLTTETVIVLGIGVILFIILIILIIVLVACVCRKRKPKQYRFKSPTTGSSNIGTPITVSAVTTSSATNGSANNGSYMNSAMQTSQGNGRHRSGAVPNGSSVPLSPADPHEMDHHHRGRRMRSPLLPPEPPGRDVPPALPPKTHGQHSRQISKASRDTSLPPGSPSKSSLSPPLSSSPHSGSIPPILPTLVPPPATISLQLSSQTMTPTSSNTSHSVPLPPSPPSSPPSSLHFHNSTSAASTVDRTETSKATNNFTFVSSSSHTSGHPYDHLVGPETGEETPSRGRPQLVHGPSSKSRSSQYSYIYVPTEEQRRLLKIQNSGRYEVTNEIEEVKGYDHLKFFKESETYWSPATTTSGLYAQLYENKYRELPREQIIIQGQIGSGHFGSVSKGVWQLRGEGGEVVEGNWVQVAVKVVKTEAEEVQRVKLLQEAAIMGQFSHPNIVRLNGVVTVGEPTMIVLEYMPQGDLKSYLHRMHPHVTRKPVPKDASRLFVKFSKDIASGMSYLTRKNFVHRDLATRNILLSHNLTCKIGDFGMARDIAGSGGGSDYYKSNGGIIPVKWTAPESLNYNKYTSASDVWSYGMVLYEIWSLGYKPFHDLANPIVIALVTSKHCQAPPPGCPRPIYHLMVECWNPKDSQRPTFDGIQQYLDSPEDSLLQWSADDIEPGKQSHILGAPLIEGSNLYIDLQRTYQNQLLAQLQSSNS